MGEKMHAFEEEVAAKAIDGGSRYGNIISILPTCFMHGSYSLTKSLKSALILFMILLIVPPLFAQTYLNGCANITTSGEYILTADITNSQGDPCFNISASNVIFDGNGHLVDGYSRLTNGFYIFRSANVTIKNTNISWWNSGIFSNESNNSIISNCSINSNWKGISLYSSYNIKIENSTIVSNADFGILVYNSLFTNISKNNLSSNGYYGVNINEGSRHSIILNNTAINCRVGVYARAAYNTTIANNVLSDSIDHGIVAGESNYTYVYGNDISGFTTYGISFSGTSPSYYVYVSNMTIRNGQDGLIGGIGGTVENVIFENNTFNIETVSNITFRNCAFAGGLRSVFITGNTIINCTFVNHTQYGALVMGEGNNFINNTIMNNSMGIQIERSNRTVLQGNNITGNNESGLFINTNRDSARGTVGGYHSIIEGNSFSSNIDTGIFLSWAENTSIRNNNFLDENYGIYSWNTTTSNISSNNFSQCQTGIGIHNLSNFNYIYGNLLEDNYYGILLWDYVYNNTISNNIALNGNYVGFVIMDSENNTVSYNSFDENTWDFYSENATENSFNYNIFKLINVSHKAGGIVYLRGAPSPENPPSGYGSIGKYLEAGNSNPAWLYMRIHYNASDITGLNEATLRAYNYTSIWTQVSGDNGVDTGAKYVYGNATVFGYFTAMGSTTGISVTLNSPANNYNDSDGAINFNCSALAPGNLANITLFIWNSTNGLYYNKTNSVVNPSNSTNWSLSGIPQGRYNWTCNATDASNNNASTGNRTFTVDTNSPAVFLSSPINYLNSSLSTIAFTCSAADNFWLSNVTLYVRNSTNGLYYNGTNSVMNPSNSTTWTLSSIPQGKYNWTCNGTDSAGNRGANGTNRTFTVDTTAPQVLLNFPANNNLTSSSSMVFNCSASDNYALSNITLYVWNSSNGLYYNNTQALAGTSSSIAWTLNPIPDGAYNWTCNGTDSAGNTGANGTNRTFIIDSSAPQVLLNFPANDNSTSSTTMLFNCSAIDSVGLSNVTLYVRNSTNGLYYNGTNSVMNPSNSTTWTLSSIPQGKYNWTCNGTDSAGNRGANGTNRTFTVDTAAPQALLIYPANSNTTSSTTMYFNCSANDNLGLSNITLFVWNSTNGRYYNGTNNALNLNNFTTWTTSNIPEGTYNWTCNGTDSAGNIGANRTNRSFTIDTSDPKVILNSPINYFNSSLGSITFNCSASNVIGLSNISLYIWNSTKGLYYNGTNGISGTSNSTNFSLTGIPQGRYNWTCNGTDIVGNIGANGTNRTFTVDLASPSIALNSPINWFNTSSTSATFNCSASDNFWLSNISIYIWNSTNGLYYNRTNSVSRASNSTTWTINGLPQGKYNWTCNGTDIVGNIGANGTNRTFTVDLASPSIALNSPINWFNTSSTSATFNCSASDNFWLSNVTLYVRNSTNGLYYNGTNSVMNPSNSTTWTLSGIPQGKYNWTCNGTDSAGNIGANGTNRTFIIDTSGPYVRIILPLNASYNYTPSLNYTVVDTLLVDKCWYTLTNGTTNVSLANCQNLSSIGSEGFNILRVYANDSVGNRNYTEVNFTIDLFPPLIFNVRNYTFPIWAYILYNTSEPANGTIVFGTSLSNLNGTSRNASYLYEQNITLQYLLKNTPYYFNITACDMAGNCNTTNGSTVTPGCTSSYSCSDWSACSGGSQSRTCTDSNFCEYPWEYVETQSCSTPSPPPSGGGGGGGGGSGSVSTATSAQTTYIAPEQRAFFSVLIKKENITIKLSDFLSLNIEAQNDTRGIEVVWNFLNGSEVVSPEGTTFSSLFLKVNGENIKGTFILTLNRTWLSEHNIDAEDVRFYEYDNGWKTAETDFHGEDIWFAYYTAGQNTNLSLFSISGSSKYFCKINSTRCFGKFIQRCDGNSWTTIETCKISCNEKTASCGLLCIPGEQRCNGNTIEECSSNGERWAASEKCGFGCNHLTVKCIGEMPEEKIVEKMDVLLYLLALLGAIIVVYAFINLKKKIGKENGLKRNPSSKILPIAFFLIMLSTQLHSLAIEDYLHEGEIFRVEKAGNSSSIVLVNGTPYFALDESKGYFIMTKAGIENSLENYYLDKYYPNETEMKDLDELMRIFNASREKDEQKCRSFVGIEPKRFNCTKENFCESCRSIPLCDDNLMTIDGFLNVVMDWIDARNSLDRNVSLYFDVLKDVKREGSAAVNLQLLREIEGDIVKTKNHFSASKLFPVNDGYFFCYEVKMNETAIKRLSEMLAIHSTRISGMKEVDSQAEYAENITQERIREYENRFEKKLLIGNASNATARLAEISADVEKLSMRIKADEQIKNVEKMRSHLFYANQYIIYNDLGSAKESLSNFWLLYENTSNFVEYCNSKIFEIMNLGNSIEFKLANSSEYDEEKKAWLDYIRREKITVEQNLTGNPNVRDLEGIRNRFAELNDAIDVIHAGGEFSMESGKKNGIEENAPVIISGAILAALIIYAMFLIARKFKPKGKNLNPLTSNEEKNEKSKILNPTASNEINPNSAASSEKNPNSATGSEIL